MAAREVDGHSGQQDCEQERLWRSRCGARCELLRAGRLWERSRTSLQEGEIDNVPSGWMALEQKEEGQGNGSVVAKAW